MCWLDNEADTTKQTERGKPEKKNKSLPSSQGVVAKKEKDGDCIEGDAAEGKVSGGENKVQAKDGNETSPENKESGDAAAAKIGAVKSVKKKIIKRIVKQKVANKTAAEANTSSKQSDKVDEDVGEQTKTEIAGQQGESSAGCVGVKTFVRKKITKKEAVGKTDQCEDNGVPLEAKMEIETELSEDKPNDNSDATAAAVKNASGKITVKKKIIKRVPKRKIPATQAKDGVAEIKKDDDKDEKKVVQAGSETSSIGKQTGSEKQANDASSSKSEINADNKDGTVTNVESLKDKEKANMKDNPDVKGGKSKDGEKPKDEKEDKDAKSRSNSNKELKEKRNSEEPYPRHPGFILRTKSNKVSNVS